MVPAVVIPLEVLAAISPWLIGSFVRSLRSDGHSCGSSCSPWRARSWPRASRHLLLLGAPLNTSMRFPATVPRRSAVAWKACSGRDLRGRPREAEPGPSRLLGPCPAPREIRSFAPVSSGRSERVPMFATDLLADEPPRPLADYNRLACPGLWHDVDNTAVCPGTLNQVSSPTGRDVDHGGHGERDDVGRRRR